jgi:F420-dependent oxidoreductase-like protein
MMDGLHFEVQPAPQKVDYPELERFTLEAEAMGYETVWIFDHFLPLYTDPGERCLEATVTLTALLTRARKIRGGFLVLGNSYRHPAIVAKLASTIDQISGGRLEFGIGAGWFEPEYRAFGIPFEPARVRLEKLEEAVQIIQHLWSKEAVDFDGRYYHLRGARCNPKPLQRPRPRIWMGGWGERYALPVIARNCDGWNVFQMALEVYRNKAQLFDRLCTEAGRNPSDIPRSMAFPMGLRRSVRDLEGLAAAVADQRDYPLELYRDHSIVGTPDMAVERLWQYVEAGVTHIIVSLRAPYDYTTLRLFMEEVAPELQRLYLSVRKR